MHSFITGVEVKGLLTKVLYNYALKDALTLNKKAHKVFVKEAVK